MNQIQQLADQAKKLVSHGLTPDKWIEVYNEKFAELLVKECASVNYNSPFQDGEFHAREVLEHFGVEE
jgi:hypothetical protein